MQPHTQTQTQTDTILFAHEHACKSPPLPFTPHTEQSTHQSVVNSGDLGQVEIFLTWAIICGIDEWPLLHINTANSMSNAHTT